jgi:hypothetical protein
MTRAGRLALVVSVASILLAGSASHAESANERRNQHKKAAAEETKGTENRQQEPLIPLAVLRATQSELSDALHTIRAEKEAAAKYNRPQKDRWDKAAVIADYLLFIVGCLYTFFAWGQWGEIKVQAGIAKRALTELEVPYVSIGEIVPHVLRTRGEEGVNPFPLIWFDFNIRNSGRSVAEVTSVHSELRILDKLPIPPNYTGVVDKSVYPVGPNSDTGKLRWIARYKFPVDKIQEEFDSLLTEHKQLVCFGYIRYSDVFETEWVSGFAWRWYPHNDGVYLVGGRSYNYNKRQEN